jgi:WXG100 family type VII secretion target
VVTYAVNMSNAQEVAEEMGVISGLINSMVSELNDQQTVNLADWTGPAQAAYKQAQAIWNNAAQDMSIQAQNAQNSLSSITNAYANAEYQGLGLWGQ